LPVAYSLYARASRVELDVQASRLRNDGCQVLPDRCCIQSVNDISGGLRARGLDLLGGRFDAVGGAARKKHLGTFGCELCGDSGADGAAAAKHNGTLLLQQQ